MVETHGVLAIFGPSDVIVAERIRVLTDQLEIPFLTIFKRFAPDLGSKRKNREGFYSVLPSYNIGLLPTKFQFIALKDLMEYWKWENMIFVHSSAQGKPSYLH